MNEDGIRKVFRKLEIPYTQTISGWVMGNCPFAPYRHANGTDRSGDFGIKIEDDGTSFINCFACKPKGSIASLCFQLSHLRNEPELREYGKKIEQDELVGGSFEFGEWEDDEDEDNSSQTLRPTKFPDERDFFSRYASVLAYPAATRYLARRGIRPTTALALGLRYHVGERRILFPVYDYWTGRFAGCSGRTIGSARWIAARITEGRKRDPKYTFPKIRDFVGLQKDRLLLFAFPGNKRSIRQSIANHGGSVFQRTTAKANIVVEGLFGFATTWQNRPRGIVLALLGSALTPGKEEILRDMDRPIFWFTDPDMGGEQCLKGPYDPVEQTFDMPNGALYKMYSDVAQFIPEWEKDDIDKLTAADIERMMENAELFVK